MSNPRTEVTNLLQAIESELQSRPIVFTAAQLKRASQIGKGERVAVRTFGELSRFAAILVRTRFGAPHVFIQDATVVDEFGLPMVIWQGHPGALSSSNSFRLHQVEF